MQHPGRRHQRLRDTANRRGSASLQMRHLRFRSAADYIADLPPEALDGAGRAGDAPSLRRQPG